MTKLWLFGALALAQEASLERLLLYSDGTYEAHWKVVCQGSIPYQLRLPGRFTHISTSQKTPAFALTVEPDTFWGPPATIPLETAQLPLGLPVTATYLAGSDLEEVKGTLQAQTPEYTVLSTPQGPHWISRSYLISLHTLAQDSGAACYPATRLQIFPQVSFADSTFYLFSWGKLPDSLRFLYLIEPLEGDSYKLTAWVIVPPLWGRAYETNLEVHWRDSLTWSLGRYRVPALGHFQVRLAEYVLRGRAGYLFSLLSLSPLLDSSLTVVEARPILQFASETPFRLPAGQGYLKLTNGGSVSFMGAFRVPTRISYPGSGSMRGILQESLRKSDRKSPPVVFGTLRVTNLFSESAYLVVERFIPGRPLPSETGLARIEKHGDSLYLLSWEAVAAPGQTLSFSYGYVRP